MKRLFDLVLAIVALILLAVPLLILAIAVKLTSRGPVLYWSVRVGKDNAHFNFPKFRSMRTEAPETLQHLVGTDWTTPLGRFMRKTSLDELPQLWSILKGDMSFVGPRPVLVKEDIFVAMRTLRGVHHLKPGLTGWAQINGRAEIKLSDKLDLDVYYLENRTFWLDIKIIFMTAFKVLGRKDIVDT